VSNPPRTPVECFATIILWLGRAVDGPSMWGHFSRPLALLILDRIRTINQAFARLAARIGAGTYIPSRPADRPRQRAGPHPRKKNPLPQGFAWLVKLVPETAVYGSQLQFLFAAPEMAALLAAAPGPMGRPIRSLCNMLGVRPPPILAPPPATRPGPSTPPAPAGKEDGGAADRPAPKPKRTEKPPRVRYVFGLRYPPPFPDPA
jgi:hypothetical protein